MKREERVFTFGSSLLAATAALTILATGASAQVVCDPDPLPVVCKSAGKTKLAIHDDPAEENGDEDTLSWAWLHGATIPAGGLGNPVSNTGTDYALCIYDGDDGFHTLVKELQIPADVSRWRVQSSNGFGYKDRTMTHDGVFLLRLKGDPNAPGASLVKLKARGIYLLPPGPPPDLQLQYFEQNPSVIVHLVNSVGTCWEAEYFPADNAKVTNKDYRATTH